MATARKSKPKAGTKTKTKTKAQASTKPNRRTRRPKVQAPRIDLDHQAASKAELEMKGDRLVVRLSRDSHPEIFELDRLTKAIDRVLDLCKRKRSTRDVADFLTETQKGIRILLRNHLEDAMRKYLK